MKKGQRIGEYWMSESELKRRFYVQIILKLSMRFRFRRWLYLGLLKIVSRICPFSTRLVSRPRPFEPGEIENYLNRQDVLKASRKVADSILARLIASLDIPVPKKEK